METPLQIEFQGMEARETLREAITAHVAQLEERFGRSESCSRSMISTPSRSSRMETSWEL
jgi:hypothetical protein